jgi:hypothetical protein
MTEDEAVQIAWQANIDRVQTAKRAMREASLRLGRVEQKVAKACARRRFPTPVELERIDTAQSALYAAREEHEAAKANFKAGVTEDQIAALMAEDE